MLTVVTVSMPDNNLYNGLYILSRCSPAFWSWSLRQTDAGQHQHLRMMFSRPSLDGHHMWWGSSHQVVVGKMFDEVSIGWRIVRLAPWGSHWNGEYAGHEESCLKFCCKITPLKKLKRYRGGRRLLDTWLLWCFTHLRGLKKVMRYKCMRGSSMGLDYIEWRFKCWWGLFTISGEPFLQRLICSDLFWQVRTCAN